MTALAKIIMKCLLQSVSPITEFICDVAPIVNPASADEFSCFVGFQFHAAIDRWSAQLGTKYVFLTTPQLQRIVAEAGDKGLKFMALTNSEALNNLPE